VNQHLNQIRDALPELFPRFGDCVVITIDGPAGSGKTTLALTLEREIDSSYTIHMDELYEGWGSTMTPTLTSKLITILESVAKDESVLFTPFNWLGNCPGTPISVKAPKYLIIEAIWIEVPEDEGLARVLERDGPEVAEFMPSFIEAQAAHFSKEDTKKSADYHLSGHHIV
jgi:hypothetical protein